jgi:hypothetical protein
MIVSLMLLRPLVFTNDHLQLRETRRLEIQLLSGTAAAQDGCKFVLRKVPVEWGKRQRKYL